ncbi:diaminopimelate epimerase [Dokdonia sp. Hel_I_53]|uniref:diaminopimelate epimerase n=1 Tax=Dokdonia sp. Hel_I_53 TaxID=1566287 RepID=UPI00119BCC58|nr:diaminopimelate epimerase [Dokdonia sp. Hel_I_53]TVZ50959.1 diaminopimelate epimerase [Dokdonia sp. Hel_I_53]
MTIPFSKYQGTGNDFIIVDNRDNIFSKNNTKLIAQMCDRKFGIGADGLMLLEKHSEVDFRMVYYNADGNESSMCGNGGRCLVAFAKALSVIHNSCTFEAIDGMHKASIEENVVQLKMQDISIIDEQEAYTFLDTGSPHHIKWVDGVDDINVKREGAALRYSQLYGEAGSNINFVEQKSPDHFKVRTYERGVEDETLSCGTGVTAAAIASHYKGLTSFKEISLDVEGGRLSVTFEKNDSGYTNVYLIGPATYVFKGEW